jgi:DNA ligase (NAD+)
VTNTVTGNTDYVIAGPGAGSKLNQARKKGVEVLNEEDFVRMVGQTTED